MQKFVQLLIIFTLFSNSIIRTVQAEDYCIEDKKPAQAAISGKEIKSLAAAAIYGATDIATTYNPDWKYVKYAGKLVGLGLIISIFFEPRNANASNDFADYYKRHPQLLQKLSKLSDKQLKTLTSSDESGEFATLVKNARSRQAH
jgi:hypothetical protein